MFFHSKFKKNFAGLLGSVIAASSLPFAGAATTISAADTENYMEALALSLYMFDSNACGTNITDGPLTWRGDCHTYDAEASVGNIDGSLKPIVDPDGDGKVDVSGGWHDAGDHIKFNLTIGFGLSSLAMSDYFVPGIYEKAGCRDHLIYELKWGADYLMKTTFLNDSGEVAAIAHVVADGNVDHSFWTPPEVQTYDRPIYWLTSSSNNSAVCGEMAAGLAGAAYVIGDSDPQYAEKCLKYAKAIFDFGNKNVGNNTSGLSGFYGTDAQYQDEMSLAQAWLWLNGESSKPTRVPKDKNYGDNQYDGWVYSWDKVWQGYASLMYKATGDTAFKDELKVELSNQGGLNVGTYNTNGWGTSRINCALQMDAYIIADGDANSNYAQGAKWQMDYILGNNNLGYSFLLGYGDKWPTHIHHRAANPGENGQTSAENPSAKYTNYGMLVGGIDGGGYEDHADRYQYTEGALDYNGCFAIACAFAADLYGGDSSTVKTIEKNASEINDSFKFGGSSDPDTTTTTTTTTTTSTTTTTTTTTCPYSLVCDKTEIEVGEKVTVSIKDWDREVRSWVASASSDCVTLGDWDVWGFTITGAKPGTAEVSVSFPGGGSDSITITVKNSSNIVWGDANEDDEINLADAVLIMQNMANPSKYNITEQGKLNGDVDETGDGITPNDAFKIQQYVLGIITSLNPNG